MKRVLFFLTAVFLLAVFAGGCGGEKKAEKPAAKPAAAETKKAEAASAPSAGGRKILVAYFSRTGEEYGVGVITKGNTAVVADAIAEITGADKFEIKTVKPYPHAYRETTDIAKKELQDNVRPEIVGKPENLKDYDTVFLGYPIWWSDLPMPVYTFLESYDWQGKTVIPFCTSAGDNMTGLEDRGIPRYAKGAKIKGEGLGLRGKSVQDNPEAARTKVRAWLKKLGYQQ